jgi:GT2 family glycosyltransferase
VVLTAVESALQSIGVVVPYYRNPEGWRRTREALEQQGVDASRIFVRDNSIDNVFYTAAVNEGLRLFSEKNDCDYVLILTQDAVLHSGSLAAMLKVMRANPVVGLVAPVSADSTGRVTWCGGSDALPWGRHFTTARDRLPRAPYPTDWVNGACVLVRKAMVRTLGLLDETMRFVFSDVDYSFRARLDGWGVVVCPFAFIEHELAGSSATAPNWLQIVKLQDQIRFAKKWGLSEHYARLAREAPRMPPEKIRALCAESRRQIVMLESAATTPQ